MCMFDLKKFGVINATMPNGHVEEWMLEDITPALLAILTTQQTVVGENPTPYGILTLWAVNGLSIVCWEMIKCLVNSGKV